MFVAITLLLAVALGVTGFVSEGASVPDALYKTSELFVVSGAATVHNSLQLELARFLGRIALSVATIRGVFAIAKANSGVIGGRILSRRHVVLIAGEEEGEDGTDDLAFLVKSPEYLKGRTLTQISSDPQRLRTALRLARSSASSEVVVALSDDQLTLETVHRVRVLHEAKKSMAPPVRAELQSWKLWSQLEHLDFGGQSGTTWFNRDEVAAQMLRAEHARLPVGHVTLCATDAEVKRLVTREQDVPGLVFSDDAQAPQLADSAIIFRQAAEDTLLSATEVTDRLQPGGTLLCVCNPELGEVLERFWSASTAKLTTVSAAEWMAPWVEMSPSEMVAQGVHEQYRHDGLIEGWIESDDPANSDWDALPDQLKESNRAFARNIASKLDSLGLCLRPISSSPHQTFEFTPTEIESLAIAEHERWVEERTASGWQPGERDIALKTTPTLVPWDALPEVERDKDRKLVAAIPAWMRKFSYEVSR